MLATVDKRKRKEGEEEEEEEKSATVKRTKLDLAKMSFQGTIVAMEGDEKVISYDMKLPMCCYTEEKVKLPDRRHLMAKTMQNSQPLFVRWLLPAAAIQYLDTIQNIDKIQCDYSLRNPRQPDATVIIMTDVEIEGLNAEQNMAFYNLIFDEMHGFFITYSIKGYETYKPCASHWRFRDVGTCILLRSVITLEKIE